MIGYRHRTYSMRFDNCKKKILPEKGIWSNTETVNKPFHDSLLTETSAHLYPWTKYLASL
jgi:hypothetical protein